mgnify:CR=1 FL=1
MKVVFAIPTHSGTLHTKCVLGLLATQNLLQRKGIEYDVIFLTECAYLPVARNTLVAMFMQDTEATDLFFIDADVGFGADSVLKILERPEPIVAGIYPLKKDLDGYPVQIKKGPVVIDGLVEAELLPTGFMRIKRTVIEELQAAYPELKYKPNVVNVAGTDVTEVYDLFNMGAIGSSEWTTEDYAFCNRWAKIGGRMWVYPDVNMTHTGNKAFFGNYAQYLGVK